MSRAGEPRRAAVLGSPIAHSLSPAMHRAGYEAAGLVDWRYDAIECTAEALPALVAGLGREWAGLSVTMPGKAAAAAVASGRSHRVEVLGVANTLLRRLDGGWFAENTDVDGVIGSLRAAGVGGSGPVERVLVLGGGGTAAAVLAALAELQSREVTLAGRRPSSVAASAELARTLGLPVTTVGWTEADLDDAARNATLVVSTVPAGTADHLAALLAGVPVLLDVVYHPWPTALAAAGEPGRVTVTGLDMLLHQGLRQFELITDVPAPAAAMRDGLRGASGSDLPLPIG
ncbi:shikimate dehydrogenase [Nakamurella leprariae]|uniref:Shikimate dehydrogenase n=1 Tax=Nakamurella leprariae TaxID=2803911 RepID=A0A939BVY1_9ACTN|nr:shikimate dehydrogenase [Nakamurella leprariae]MBM9466988.1 shikimate dehydrogenase [Nakamurella leprariae]